MISELLTNQYSKVVMPMFAVAAVNIGFSYSVTENNYAGLVFLVLAGILIVFSKLTYFIVEKNIVRIEFKNKPEKDKFLLFASYLRLIGLSIAIGISLMSLAQYSGMQISAACIILVLYLSGTEGYKFRSEMKKLSLI
ncbi:hypothetical protein [Marinobacter orientalis]|uniref:Uncharacterized protein n=1 Tax=Marinobacter orientalis TaxID=1928859 RepID=A0A7Y0RC15_9GAMM|nr:hypothetical protein [Marinobacter orientalis]NMT63469.1 hypothetical protein [Marinobacter orientalis]TGX48530.1 hypothetical protein DIT72_14145 [Marinobacter orientalis]